MPKTILIIGAVAAGPKAASRARRLDPEARILVVDKDSYISYGGCGIPYYVGGDVADVEGLLTTAYHMKRDVRFFDKAKGVEVRDRTEALALNRKAKTVRLKDLRDGREYEEQYDSLVLATGSRPFVPPIPGRELPGVTTVANLHDAVRIKELLQAGSISSAVVIGAGAIGLEMAESMTDLWDVQVTVLEALPQLLPQALCPDMARLVQDQFERHGVTVLTGDSAARIVGSPETGVQAVETASGKRLECQLVILSVGVRPNVDLGRDAGLAVGRFGGYMVNARMQTSDPAIYAGGDCVEVPNIITGQSAYMPLGSMANRQGRVIGTNVAAPGGNGPARFDGAVGSFCMKAFDMGVARAGLTMAQAKAAGFDPAYAIVPMMDRAHFYPTAKMLCMKLLADRRTRRVLGVQALGVNGDAVKARVDAVAAAMQQGAVVEDISNLEAAYSPPYAQAMDIVNAVANTLDNVLDGVNQPMPIADFLAGFKAGAFDVVDVRGASNAEPYIKAYGDRWMNIPSDQLAERAGEIDPAKPVVLFCNTGQRSYEAQVLLRKTGRPSIPNVEGGHLLLSLTDRGFLGDEG